MLLSAALTERVFSEHDRIRLTMRTIVKCLSFNLVSLARSSSPLRSGIAILLAVAALGAGGQDRLPAELLAVPVWPGEDAARKNYSHQYVFRGQPSEIVVYWPDPARPDHWALFRFWLQNRVDPQIRVTFSRGEEGTFQYRYTVRNGDAAKTAIWNWTVVGPADQDLRAAHPAWGGWNNRVAAAPQVIPRNAPLGAYLSWTRGDAPAIQPDAEASGFEIESTFRPGLTTAYASGDGGILRPPAWFTQEVEEQVIPLQRAYVMRKPTVTFGPRFAPSAAPRDILAAYSEDIDNLVRDGIVSGQSAYIRELQKAIRTGIRDGVIPTLTPIHAPESPFKKELDAALRLAVKSP
jgi:hypothetical protein